MIASTMLGQQRSASGLLSSSFSCSKLYSDHRDVLQLPSEPRSVLDSWSPSPTSSAISPSFVQSSCESGGSDGGGRGAAGPEQQHHPHHEAHCEAYAEPLTQVEQRIQADDTGSWGVESGATEQGLDEVPLIDCSSLLVWGDNGGLELGKIHDYPHNGVPAEALSMFKVPGTEENGVVASEGGSMALSINAFASESVLEMFSGASEPTLDEMFGCLGPRANGHGELLAEQILGQVCEPNQGQEAFNIITPPCDAPSLPLSSLFQQDQQARHSSPQQGLPFSIPFPFSQSKRPRFNSFPSVLFPDPQPQPQPQEPSHQLFVHKKQATAHRSPLHHHLASSPPWPAPSNLRPSVLHPALPIHFPDLDYLPSHAHPRLLGKNIPFADLLHFGNQLTKAVEAAEFGNTDLTQAILARLNSFSSSSPHPTAPLLRAVSLFEKAIVQQTGLVQQHPSTNLHTLAKISAYRSFCATSPVPQFSHFVANQSALEVINGGERIHIVDFELGLGERWASLMQELSQKGKGPVHLRITAVMVGSSGDGSFTCELAKESLLDFAKGLNMIFCFEAVPLAKLNSLIGLSKEALLVNLGSNGLSQLLADLGSPEPVLSLLYFIKSLSPKVITMIDRECYAMGGWGSSFLTQALRLCAFFIEAVDSSGMDADAMAAIEQHVLAPQVYNAVKLRRVRQNMPPWKTLLQRAGFSLRGCSAATEAQAGCLIKGPYSGYSVAKQQSALVLAWQSVNLLQASSWEQ